MTIKIEVGPRPKLSSVRNGAWASYAGRNLGLPYTCDPFPSSEKYD